MTSDLVALIGRTFEVVLEGGGSWGAAMAWRTWTGLSARAHRALERRRLLPPHAGNAV